MRRPLLLALPLLLGGCGRAYTVTMGPQPSVDAHYVVVKTRWNGKMRVFDCMSRPEGEEWTPTCKQVKMQSHMGGALDEGWNKLRSRRKDRDDK